LPATEQQTKKSRNRSNITICRNLFHQHIRRTFSYLCPRKKKGKKKYAENGIQDREDVGNDNNNRQSHSSIGERAMKREQMKDFTHLILYLIVLCCVLFCVLIYSRSASSSVLKSLKKKRSMNFV
jgi:hypothetical protein